MNAIHHINVLHDHLSRYWKNIWQKAIRKLGREENFLNLIKGIYGKPLPNTTVNDGRLCLLFNIRNEVCCPSPLLFSVMLEKLDSVIKQEKYTKNCKGRSKAVFKVLVYFTSQILLALVSSWHFRTLNIVYFDHILYVLSFIN
jgi:hypothetical protein